ncbi:hypothetical protein LLG96_11940 [bacterium]|nr:hypothetical protein [bacterium]
MIKPPFTLLVIKKTHEPVTVRITFTKVLAALVLAIMISLISGFGLTLIIARFHIPFLLPVSDTISVQSGSRQSPLVSESAVNSMEDSSRSTELKNFTVSAGKKNEFDIAFSLAGADAYDQVYVWIIINPDSDIAGETIIHPRNPVFRGIPVDYRNGAVYDPVSATAFQVSLSEATTGIEIRDFRILIYSRDGAVLVDKRFVISESKGSESS